MIYSSVLLAAFATAPEIPAGGIYFLFEFGFRDNPAPAYPPPPPCGCTWPGPNGGPTKGNGDFLPLPMPAPPSSPQPADMLPAPRRQDTAMLASRHRPATLIVRIPAGALLFIDGQRKDNGSLSQRFVTPPLQRGDIYAYTLQSEVTRSGRTYVQTKRVLVRAGETIQVSFPEPGGSPIVQVSVLERE